MQFINKCVQFDYIIKLSMIIAVVKSLSVIIL
jgi:hypothetical protein